MISLANRIFANLCQKFGKTVRARLSYRISLAAALLTMVFILAIGGTSYSTMRAQMTASIKAALDYEATLQTEYLSLHLNSITSSLESLSQNALLLNALMDSFAREAFLIPFLRGFNNINAIPVTVTLIDFQGNPVAANGALSLDSGAWRHQVLEEGKPYAATTTTTAGELLFIVEPIFYAKTPSPEGALVYALPLENLLQSTLKAYPLYHNVRLIHRSSSLSTAPVPAQSIPDTEGKSIVKTYKLPVADVLAPLDLAIAVNIERSLLDIPLQHLFRSYVLIGSLVVLMVLGLSFIAGRRLTRPLRELEGVAAAVISSGSFDHRFAVQGVDEIARLGSAFNQMLDKLRSTYAKLERESEQRLAELAERKRAEAALRESEQRFRMIFDAINDAVFVHDPTSGAILDVNRKMCEMYGYTRAEAVQVNVETLSSGKAPYSQREMLGWMKKAAMGESQLFEWRAKDKQGRLFWVEINMRRAVIGNQDRLLMVARDITERKKNEAKIHRLNRILVTLNQGNQAIFQAQSREELFESVCRIVVQHGEFKLAWIGWHNPQTQAIEPVACSEGDSDYLKLITVYADERPEGLGPTGIAFREGREVICNDFAQDSRTELWREPAARFGYQSSSAFPIRVNGVVRGTLNIYATEPEFFQQCEVDLLNEVAANISATLDKFEAEAQRQQAEESLRESEEQFITFMNHLPAVAFIKNKDCRTVYANRYLQNLFIFDDPIGKTTLESFPEEIGRKMLADDLRALTEGPIQLEEAVSDTNGFTHILQTIKFPIQRRGKPPLLGGIAVDITERKRMEETLRESKERYRLLIENQTDLVVKVDPENRFLFVSPSYCELFGKTEEEFLGANFMPLGHEEDREVMAKSIANLFRPPYTDYHEQRALTKNGWRWLAWADKAVLDENNNIVAIVGVGRDITDRKRAEQALLEEKERALVTLHSIGDAVITTDAAGVVQYLNPVAEMLTGWSTDAARGQPLATVFRIIDEETRQPASDPVARCLQEGRIVGLANHTILLSQSGREYAIQDSAAPIRGPAGEVFGAVLVFSDVTETRQLAQALSYQATHDALTGLINRQEFERRLRRVLETTQTGEAEHALGYLDLDQFKLVNDTCGHAAGDELLRQLSSLLKEQVRRRDTLARLGGDEFGVLMEHCSVQQALRVAEALRKAVENFRFLWEDKSFHIGVSIGLVPITTVSKDSTRVLSAADAACYMAKEQGRNRIHIYQADDVDLAQRHGEMQWATRIPRALEEDRFRLSWQPIIPIKDNGDAQEHYELLLRLEDESGCLLSPGAFLASAERFNLASKLDRWVISTALQWLTLQPIRLQQLSLCAINLSGYSLSENTFLAFVMDQLETTRVPPEKLCFEITETVAIANLTNATRFIKALKARGCCFALDDFGSGLSSFAYLKNLPVDFLKIDGMFVKDIVDDPISFAMVKSIHEIGQVMGKQTIAEFVENEQILAKLREIGVNYAQGYFIGQPRLLNEKVFLEKTG
jgi:diguanylate cyclase (GGDEF)-like protein/PAS domain S-box-containing protein